MKRSFLFLVGLVFLVLACGESPANTAETGAAEGTATSPAAGYEMEAVPGSDCQRAVQRDPNGNIVEAGFVCNGKRSGTWIVNHSGKNEPQTVISYINGVYNGLYLQLNDRGQIELMATYKNNKLHGPWGEYRFGRPEKTATYKDGELDGWYREYEFRTGALKQEASYKEGVQDGPMRYYNEAGEVILEYTYKDGEKVEDTVQED
jgi:antitoxin component YwqK of YwqJK toxin-antitoxin module